MTWKQKILHNGKFEVRDKVRFTSFKRHIEDCEDDSNYDIIKLHKVDTIYSISESRYISDSGDKLYEIYLEGHRDCQLYSDEVELA